MTDVRSWFGLVNQIAYAFSMTEKMLLFHQLLKPVTSSQLTDELQGILENSKPVIASQIQDGVRIFDPSKLTCLGTDCNKTGTGFCLHQKHWKNQVHYAATGRRSRS